MLHVFDNIYKKNRKCKLTDLNSLQNELVKLNFKNNKINNEFSSFLCESNGGYFISGERIFDIYSTEEIPLVYLEYKFYKFMPYALPIASDGSGNIVLFDQRCQGNEKIYCVSAGNLGWEKDQCFYLADNFTHYICQRTDITIYM